MKAQIRGTEIYFDIAGMQLTPYKNDFIEKPVLFMLHGGPGGDHLRFKQHSLALSDKAQLVFIDHRGCGRSKKTKMNDYTLENNIEDIEALRKYLGLNKICVLGTSYGGIVAQGYAIRYPKHVEKLILVVTAPSYGFIEEAKAILKKKATNKQLQFCEHLWNGTFKDSEHVAEFFKVMESLYSNRPPRQKKPAKIKTIWSHEALNKGFSEILPKYDFRKQLRKITAPTLILAGKDDWICPPSQSKIIAENIPTAILKILPASHAIAVDAQKQYIRLISHFLDNKIN